MFGFSLIAYIQLLINSVTECQDVHGNTDRTAPLMNSNKCPMIQSARGFRVGSTGQHPKL